jgi:16S rRNA (guanine527-N7)-methyltransferase
MVVFNYFKELSEQQMNQFAELYAIYKEWNAKINVVSRKNFENFEVHHVLHSLAIAKVVDFLPNQHVIDVGTGGGFPGIPLAILFPDTKFTLCDSIRKKIKVVDEVVKHLQLENVATIHARSEAVHLKFDALVSRAVTRFEPFMHMTKHLLKPNAMGMYYLKGGDLAEELSELKATFPKKQIHQHPIKKEFNEEFFETKYVVEVN